MRVEQRESLGVDEQDGTPAAGPVPREELGQIGTGVEEQFGQASLVAQHLSAARPRVRQEHGDVQIAGRGGTTLSRGAAQNGSERLRETGGDQAQRLRGRIVVISHGTASWQARHHNGPLFRPFAFFLPDRIAAAGKGECRPDSAAPDAHRLRERPAETTELGPRSTRRGSRRPACRRPRDEGLPPSGGPPSRRRTAPRSGASRVRHAATLCARPLPPRSGNRAPHELNGHNRPIALN